MTTCAACGSAVEARWKFCIRCGAPAPTFALTPREATPPPPIPSAIRPSALDEADDDHDLPPERDQARVDLPRAIGIALAIAGIALVVYISVALSGGL